MKRAALVAVVATAVLLAGCATIVRPGGAPDRAAWQAREQRLSGLDDWYLAGRVGVDAPHHSGSASLDWCQRGAYMKLLFSGPFGLGAVKLWGTARTLYVRNAKGQTWVSDAPQQALVSALGWPLPVASLRYWVLGLPAPVSGAALQIGSRGLLRDLQQQGWHVHYQTYLLQAGFLLPQRLLLTRGATRIKLLVSRWAPACTQ